MRKFILLLCLMATSFFAVAAESVEESREEGVVSVHSGLVGTVFPNPAPTAGRIYRLTGVPFVGNRLVLRAKPYGNLSRASYAWKRDGVTVATTERLDIPWLTPSDFGSYTLTVTTPYGTATSEPYVVEQRAGTVVSWGASAHGRTETPEGMTGVAQVASGMNFNLALSTNGTVAAWGYNGHGACDVPEGLWDVSYIAAGSDGSTGAGFAVKTDGSVVAWKNFAESELGTEVIFSQYPGSMSFNTSSPAKIVSGVVNLVGQGVVPGTFSVNVGGKIVGSDDKAGGIAGTGIAKGSIDYSSGTWSVECATVAPAGVFVSVTWKYRVQGRQSNDPSHPFSFLEELKLPESKGLTNVVQIAVGGKCAIALRADGTVQAFGDAAESQFPGSMSFKTSSAAKSVSGVVNQVGQGIVPGTFSVNIGGKIVGSDDKAGGIWGTGIAMGSIDYSSGTWSVEYASAAPAGISVSVTWKYKVGQDFPVANIDDAVAVSAGYDSLMALMADGTVVSWSGGESSVPEGLCNVLTIASGKMGGKGRASFALDADGVIAKWGDEYDYFGMGASTAADAVAIDAGQEHLMALCADGNVRVWAGYDSYGVKKVPTCVTNAIGIAAAGYHCSAILPDSDGDSIADSVELEYGRDPFVWEDYRRATISGTVTCEGEPIAGARVLFYTVNGKLAGRGVSDETGAYSVNGLLPASFRIKVQCAGAIDIWYDDVIAGRGEGILYPITEGGEITGLDFELSKGQADALTKVCAADDSGEFALPDGMFVYLDMLPAELGANGKLDLGEVGASHSVYIDQHGASHAIDLMPHQITAKVPGGAVPAPVAMAGVEGETEVCGLVIEGETGAISVATEPAGAEVFIDYADEALGVTPVTVGNLLPGSHTVLLRKDGYLRPRPVSASVAAGGMTELVVPLAAVGETNEMSVAVSSAIPGMDIYLDYLPTGDVTPATVGGMDPASHAGEGWHSASHSILLRHPMMRPFAARVVPEPAFDPESGEEIPAVLEIDAPNSYDDANGNGIRNIDECLSGANPFYLFEEALDAYNLRWKSGGDMPWMAVETEEGVGGGFARSGAIGDAQSSWIETTVKGAGRLIFSWKISCQARYDKATFSVDGATVKTINGTVCWTCVTQDVAEVAEHVFRWEYAKNPTTTVAPDCAWLDNVQWIPDIGENARKLTVESRFGAPNPGVGEMKMPWGESVTATMPGDVYSNGNVRARCIGWTGTGDVPAKGMGTRVLFTLENDSTLTWNWAAEYLVTATSSGRGTVDISSVWVKEGEYVVITATPTGELHDFRWTGDIAGATINGYTITVPVDSPKAITAVFTALTLEEALDGKRLVWTSDGDLPWEPVTDVTFDGDDAAQSGLVYNEGVSAIETTVSGAGTFSFVWKLETEIGYSGIEFFVDGELADGLYESTDWNACAFELGEGGHTLRFEFFDGDSVPGDAAWLDCVSFVSEGEFTETQTTPVPVPYAWLDKYGLGDGTEAAYETAAKATAANGVNKVWECYVAGLDPTDAESLLRTLISCSDGEVRISWTPNLNTDGVTRIYKVYGRTELDKGTWETPFKPWHRFFKVTVAMPTGAAGEKTDIAGEGFVPED